MRADDRLVLYWLLLHSMVAQQHQGARTALYSASADSINRRAAVKSLRPAERRLREPQR